MRPKKCGALVEAWQEVASVLEKAIQDYGDLRQGVGQGVVGGARGGGRLMGGEVHLGLTSRPSGGASFSLSLSLFFFIFFLLLLSRRFCFFGGGGGWGQWGG